VDTSYTKFNRKPDPIDDNAFDKVVPPADLLYVGWTVPGEWFNITVDVTHAENIRGRFPVHIESWRNNIRRWEWTGCDRAPGDRFDI
jgi:hypothetical protein